MTREGASMEEVSARGHLSLIMIDTNLLPALMNSIESMTKLILLGANMKLELRVK